jgi:hypothetical protein
MWYILSTIHFARGKMVTIAGGNWIADMKAMRAWNIEDRIVVCFKKKGEALHGEIRDMPVELLGQWAGEGHIRRAVEEAEEVFLRAYFERDIEESAKL